MSERLSASPGCIIWFNEVHYLSSRMLLLSGCLGRKKRNDKEILDFTGTASLLPVVHRLRAVF